MRIRMTPAAALMMVAAPVLAAQSRPPAQSQAPSRATLVTTLEGISEYLFPNGLRVLLLPDSSKSDLTVSISYFGGSRHEGYGETGMAHLIEHLVVKSSKRYPSIPASQTQHGAAHNASTGFDFTNFYETFPASDANLAWALELEADRMVNAGITKENLTTEYSVVLNERELGANDVMGTATNRMMHAMFQWHPYGRTTIGAESDVRNVPVDRLQSFYRRFYQPDNAMLILIGRFNPTRALAAIDRTVAAVPRPIRSAALGNLLPGNYTVEPTQDGENYSVVRRAAESQWVMVGYHIPGVAHPDFAPLSVLADVLFSNPSGRFYKAIVDTRRASGLNGTAWYLGDGSMLGVRANLRVDQSLDTVRAMLTRMLDSARTATYTEEEVTRATTSLRRNIQLELNNPSQAFAIRLSDWAAFGDWRLYFYHRDRLGRVTPADVQRVAGLYLKPSNATTVVVIPTAQPDRVEIPRSPNVATMLAGYKGQSVAQSGEAFDATPANIDARTTRVRLPNGMWLSMLSKETRGNRVVGQIILRHGSEATLTGKSILSQITGAMLARGTMQLTRQQIIDSLSKLTSAVAITSTGNSVTVTLETTRPNLPAVLDLAAQQLRSPRFDPEELDRLKKERLLATENGRANPITAAGLALDRRLAPKPKGHPLYRSTVDETVADINAVTIDAVKAHYATYFGASYADMAVVGDFDPAEVQTTMSRALGDWRNAQPFERLVRAYVKSDSAFDSVEIPDKPTAVVYAGVTVQMSDTDADYPALALANYILAAAPTSSRLFKRLREKEGLTYGVGGFLTAQAQDRFATWQTNALAAPQNVDRLQRLWREEIDRALAEGFTQAEVDQYRPGFLESRARSRANDPELVSMLVNRRNAGRTMAYDDDIDKKLAALTAADVTAAFRKYIRPNEIVLIHAGSLAPKR
jgi:zinc protease